MKEKPLKNKNIGIHMLVPFDVTVIIPALHLDNDFLRCLFSIRAAFKGRLKYEIIVVVPNISDFSELPGTDLNIIIEDEPGIYGAMNMGVKKAKGRYRWMATHNRRLPRRSRYA